MQISRVKPADAKTEKLIITSMIVSERYCRSIKSTYDNKYFQSKMTKTVATWCMDFFLEYDDAPRADIQTIYERKSKAGAIEPDLEESIEKFLSNLSSEYEEWEENFNVAYYADITKDYFKKRSFVSLSEELKNAAENDDPNAAEKIYFEYTQVKEELDTSSEITSVEGVHKFKVDYENQPPYLFTMPGALGELLGPIERESFIGILGREKVGKTYHLMIFANAAARMGLNVVMFQTGDLTKTQIDTRFANSRTGKTSREEKVGDHWIPVLDCLKNQTGECDQCKNEPIVSWKETENGNYYQFDVDTENEDVLLSHTTCIDCWKDKIEGLVKFQGSIWWKKQKIKQWTWSELERCTKRFKKYHKGSITTESYTMNTVTITDIRDWLLKKHKEEGKSYDLVIVDSPDICSPEKSYEQKRHQENEKWMNLRGISQEFHNCVIATSQADAKSYDKDTLALDNFSEDKRKFGHVTHFLSINKAKWEEDYWCTRMAKLIIREDSLQLGKQVTLLHSFPNSRTGTASFIGRVPRPLYSREENTGNGKKGKNNKNGKNKKSK